MIWRRAVVSRRARKSASRRFAGYTGLTTALQLASKGVDVSGQS
jgi:hypothetical protein